MSGPCLGRGVAVGMTTAALEVEDATQDSLCVVKKHTLQEVTLYVQNTQDLRE